MFNPESSLYLVRFRWLDPSTGRWVERDPLGYVDGASLYEYVGGQSFQFRDHLGLERDEDVRRGVKNGQSGTYHHRYKRSRRWYELWLVERTEYDEENSYFVPDVIAPGDTVIGDDTVEEFYNDRWAASDELNEKLDRTVQTCEAGMWFGGVLLATALPGPDEAVAGAVLGRLLLRGSKAATRGVLRRLGFADDQIDEALEALVKTRYGGDPSSEKLGKNMRAIGNAKPSGYYDAHHLVMLSKNRNPIAQQKLKEFGIDIDSAVNGVWVPKWVHERTHTKAYSEAVEKLFETADSLEDVMTALDILKIRVLRGDFLKERWRGYPDFPKP